MNVIITGASRGLGFELVKKFAAKPENNVVALSRNEQKLLRLKEECQNIYPHSNVFPIPFDITSGAFEKLPRRMVDFEIQSIDILINNAGLLINKPFMELNADDFDNLFEVNVKGAFRLIQCLIPMMKTNSHILNISSMGGYQGSMKFPGLSLYSSSKGAIAIFTECLAEELKEQSISANCLAIGAVQTEMLAEAFPGFKAPLSPSSMAEYILEFATNGHHYYNGKILPVSLSTP
ncbi:MAG: SDR family oxidoreductase [Bacteroidales bacterium]